MENNTVFNQRLKCPILCVPQLKVGPPEENISDAILCREEEKSVDLTNLKSNKEEGISNNEFIESAPIERAEDEKEDLDQKEFNSYLEESFCIKQELKTLEEEFVDDIPESHTSKKETDDINEVVAEGFHFKSEYIKLEEVHIKDEEDIQDSLNKKIPKPRKKTVLHHCSECPYSTNRKGCLKVHLLIHKKEDEIDWYRCQECPYKTCRKNDLRRHADVHNNLMLNCLAFHTVDPNNSKQIKIFKCTECSYKSELKQKLKTHQSIDDQSSWFQCTDCDYKTDLKKHQVQYRSENREGRHKCLKCSYKTRHKSNLLRHIITHKSVDEIQWFKCSQCGFKTAHERSLKRHQVKHREEHEVDLFCCYECGFTAKRKLNLVAHISKHKKKIDEN